MSPEEFQKKFNASEEAIERLKTYESLLKKWQKAVNLVSPGTVNEIWLRHFADSAQILQHLPSSRIIIADMGSGAGFPSMVLALLRPDLGIHLIESDGKKSEFLKTVSRETGTPVTIHNQRVEKILPKINPDWITARAFAPLKEILSITNSLSPQSRLLLLKGKTAESEIAEAQKMYDFECDSFQSETSPDSKILRIAMTDKIGA